MGDKPEDARTSRRDFLKLATASAPGAVAAVAAVSTGAAQADDLQADDQGLRDTAHIRAYYESLQF